MPFCSAVAVCDVAVSDFRCRIVNRPGWPSGLAGEFPALPSGRSDMPTSNGKGENINSVLFKRINGNGKLTDTKNAIFYVSYVILTVLLRMNVFLT